MSLIVKCVSESISWRKIHKSAEPFERRQEVIVRREVEPVGHRKCLEIAVRIGRIGWIVYRRASDHRSAKRQILAKDDKPGKGSSRRTAAVETARAIWRREGRDARSPAKTAPFFT